MLIYVLLGIFLSSLMVLLLKIFAEMASLKYGIDEVDKYAGYFASISGWISGITVPIFTFLSLILLYKTFNLQKKELVNTRSVINQQQFENTFFNMINLHINIVEKIEFEGIKSRKGLELLWEDLDKKINNLLKGFFTTSHVNYNEEELNKYRANYKDEEYIKNKFKDFESDNGDSLGHYFRHMYRIVKFISDSNLSKDEKREYLGIFRAQLSSAELNLLFYNINYSAYSKKFHDILQGTYFFKGHVDELIKEGKTLSVLNKKKYEELNNNI